MLRGRAATCHPSRVRVLSTGSCAPCYNKPRQRAAREELKKEFIAAFGGKCMCCGESEHAFLTMEHLQGGGHEHRRALGVWGVYKAAKDEGYPKDKYALLCMNCNHAKMRCGGVCPHERQR